VIHKFPVYRHFIGNNPLRNYLKRNWLKRSAGVDQKVVDILLVPGYGGLKVEVAWEYPCFITYDEILLSMLRATAGFGA
jgi:hypothetical protein